MRDNNMLYFDGRWDTPMFGYNRTTAGAMTALAHRKEVKNEDISG